MKIIPDIQIVKRLVSNPNDHPLIPYADKSVIFRWPSLLEYLELGSIFSNLPSNQKLYESSITALCASDEKELIFYIYDQIFADLLNQISALPQIKPPMLLQSLENKREKMLQPTLDTYENSLRNKPTHTLHDLILFLAWDRMCVFMGRLFDHQTTDPKFVHGIKILKECLIESFQHITEHKRTTPSLYRMLESFLYFNMREENLRNFSADEGVIISQAFQTLKPQDELADFFYIDDAILPHDEVSYLASDSPEKIKVRLAFANYMLAQLKAAVPNWNYSLRHANIITLILLFICSLTRLEAASADALHHIFSTTANPFTHDLHVKILPSQHQDADVCICMHGMGSDTTVSEVMRANPVIPHHIVAFNFPDYGPRYQSAKTTFGTFNEIAPALFVLKKCIVDGGVDKIHLYGFSAGGGAIINILAALNSNRFDMALQKLGINAHEKQKILQSIEQGSVILEVPLKSFDEIADVYGDQEMRLLAKRARENEMVPIENLKELQGLSLNCFVYFAYPDKALSNRDDAAFITRLKNVNAKGQTIALIGKNAGHTTYHGELWNAYQKYINDQK